MFWSLCNVDPALSERNRVASLKGPLATGQSFEDIQVDGQDAIRIWRPDMNVAVDKAVNNRFIRELCDRVYDNEKVSG